MDDNLSASSGPLTRPIGRRLFLGGAAFAAAAPILTEAQLAWAAAASVDAPPKGMALHGQGRELPPPGAVLINANENPLGPTKAACEAIARIAPLGGRYDLLGETRALAATFAEQHGLKPENIAVYAGSSEPLHYTVLAFTSPERGLVTADPVLRGADGRGGDDEGEDFKVALTSDYAHDVKAMIAADPNAGVIYICNPNNPTGTMTPRETSSGPWRTSPRAPSFSSTRRTSTSPRRPTCWTW